LYGCTETPCGLQATGAHTPIEGNDLIKLREAAEAKIHAFIQMLGAERGCAQFYPEME
jgi:hypothetical protein